MKKFILILASMIAVPLLASCAARTPESSFASVQTAPNSDETTTESTTETQSPTEQAAIYEHVASGRFMIEYDITADVEPRKVVGVGYYPVFNVTFTDGEENPFFAQYMNYGVLICAESTMTHNYGTADTNRRELALSERLLWEEAIENFYSDGIDRDSGALDRQTVYRVTTYEITCNDERGLCIVYTDTDVSFYDNTVRAAVTVYKIDSHGNTNFDARSNEADNIAALLGADVYGYINGEIIPYDGDALYIKTSLAVYGGYNRTFFTENDEYLIYDPTLYYFFHDAEDTAVWKPQTRNAHAVVSVKKEPSSTVTVTQDEGIYKVMRVGISEGDYFFYILYDINGIERGSGMLGLAEPTYIYEGITVIFDHIVKIVDSEERGLRCFNVQSGALSSWYSYMSVYTECESGLLAYVYDSWNAVVVRGMFDERYYSFDPLYDDTGFALSVEAIYFADSDTKIVVVYRGQNEEEIIKLYELN